MGYTKHLSRREILQSIPVLSSGTLLLPLGVLHGQSPDTRTPGVIRGALRDKVTGKPVAAKIRVTDMNTGEPYMPASAIKTMPQRTRREVKHYFYAKGSYEIAVPPGRYQIEVVRGICHDVATAGTEVGAGITHVHDFEIPVLWDSQATGWFSGNTHTHYHLELDEDPDDRLRMVPPAEALDVASPPPPSFLCCCPGKTGSKLEAAGSGNRSRCSFCACVAGTPYRPAKRNTIGHTVKSNYPPTKGPM